MSSLSNARAPAHRAMSCMQSGILALSVLLGSAWANATTEPSAGLRSYAQARAVLDAAVDAIGGQAALESLHGIRREVNDDWVDVGQGKRPWNGTPDADHLVPHDFSANSEMVAYVDYATRRYFQSVKYVDSPAEYAVEINAGDPDAAYYSLRYVDERPFVRELPPAERAPALALRLRRHPEGLLRLALEHPETLACIGHARANGGDQDVISVTDASGSLVFLYIDARTHLLAKSETLRAHPIGGDTSTEILYSDYRRVGPLLLPYRYVDRVAGVPTHYVRVRSIDLDASADENVFVAPPDGVRIEENPSDPVLQRMGDGLYLVRAAYNVMFAVFEDYVLVMESPAGSTYAQQILDLVHETAPGKPIRYAVASHFHFDHVAAVRTFVAEGVTIVTTPDAKPVIEQSLAGRRTLHPDALSARPRPATIEVVADRRAFEDARQRVEIYDFGPTPHVTQLLVAYFPKEKVLHVADLYDVLTTELPIAGVDAVAMARKIDELGLDVERIVPVHGVPATMEDLRRGLTIRAKYVH